MQKVFNEYEILTFFLYNTGQLQQGKVLKNINPKVAVEFVKRAQHYVLF